MVAQPVWWVARASSTATTAAAATITTTPARPTADGSASLSQSAIHNAAHTPATTPRRVRLTPALHLAAPRRHDRAQLPPADARRRRGRGGRSVPRGRARPARRSVPVDRCATHDPAHVLARRLGRTPGPAGGRHVALEQHPTRNDGVAGRPLRQRRSCTGEVDPHGAASVSGSGSPNGSSRRPVADHRHDATFGLAWAAANNPATTMTPNSPSATTRSTSPTTPAANGPPRRIGDGRWVRIGVGDRRSALAGRFRVRPDLHGPRRRREDDAEEHDGDRRPDPPTGGSRRSVSAQHASSAGSISGRVVGSSTSTKPVSPTPPPSTGRSMLE